MGKDLNNKSTIRKHILVPLSTTLLFLLSVYTFGAYTLQEKHFDKDIKSNIEFVNDHFQDILGMEAKQMEILIDFLDDNDNMKSVFLARDRNRLFLETEAIFREMKSRYNVTHFYFHDPDKVCFLRVHNPERHGDIIERFTLDQSVREGTDADGIELGPLGTFTLRVVHPLHFKGQLIGYIELGKDIEYLKSEVKKEQGLDMILTVFKSRLNRDGWEEGLKILGKTGNWDQLSSKVIIDKTPKDISPKLVEYLNLEHPDHHREIFKFSLEKHKYRGGILPLKDVSGLEIGDIFIFKDFTVEAYNQMLSGLMAALSGMIGMILIIIFYIYIGRMERRLNKTHDDMVFEIEERKRAETELQQNRDELEMRVDKRTEELVIANDDLRKEVIERKRIEEALKESEEQFRSVVETADDGIIAVDEHGKIISWNMAASNIFGYPAEEKIGSEIVSLMPERFHEIISRGIDKLVSENKTGLIGSRLEMTGIKKQGTEFPFELSISSWEIKHRLFFTGFVRDITDRKVAEAEKEKLEAQLLQAQKMEAIGTLAGGIAHDFNNILVPIIGYTEMSLDGVPRDNYLYGYLKNILKASLRAKELVQQILTFSRRNEIISEPVFVQIVIREALKLIRSTLPSTIKIIKKIDDNCGPVQADPTQIHQIVMNLCTNAYHAMSEDGGKIEVFLQEVVLEETDSDNMHLSPGIYLMLLVRDTGKGIDSIIVDRIFEPYFTTKDKEKGTGLGLAVVHGIVKNYGGAISVSTKLGKGSEFRIYLPRITVETGVIQPSDVPDIVMSGNERVLIVDDEENVLDMMNLMIMDLGYKVTAFTNSKDVLNVLRKHPDAFDLVITDMTMPEMTGIQLSKKIQAIRKDIPIILFSGYNENLSGKLIADAGISKYLMKPVSKKEMAASIRQVLDGKKTSRN